MKEKLKRNYKLIVGIIIGVIVSLGSTYAVTTISSSDISYDNSTSGLTSTNMKGAIDELYEKVNNKPCKVIKGTGMDANDEIKCGTEEFYVMDTTGGDSIVTLTKYPIEGGIAYLGSECVYWEGGVCLESRPIPKNIDNPSYAQNKNCGNTNFLCYGLGFADNYKSVLEKIGLSDSIEVKKPSLSDLNKVGCSFSLETQYDKLSGSCEKFSWLKEVVVTDIAEGPQTSIVVSSEKISHLYGMNWFTGYEKLMVKIPTKDISL